MPDSCVRVHGLSKKYRIGQGAYRYGRLTESVWGGLRAAWGGSRQRLERTEIWALQDVSFEVREGEVVGIIGRNGAGKSTLLKILTRITEPTHGRAELRGRVGSLLEVGSGFHPELTGRENIYLNAAILGMKKADTYRRFDEIVMFADVEKFLDTPLKRYSSGMYIRLAFAVAAHLEPEILIVDEVLSVGDIEFQKKCLGKMGDVAREGRTVIFVSHQMNSIRRLCDRSFWLESGMIKKEGPTAKVVGAYESRTPDIDDAGGQGRLAKRSTHFRKWKLVQPGADESNWLMASGPIAMSMELEIAEPIKRGIHGIALRNEDGQLMWAWAIENVRLDPGIREFTYRLPSLPLRPGVYSWHVSLSEDAKVLDQWECSPRLVIATDSVTHPRDEWTGVLNIPCQFEIR